MNNSIRFRTPSLRSAASTVLLAALLATATPALANPYESAKAGHPLRVTAYFLHPVGVVLDVLIFRPAHWVVSHDGLRTLFGHTEE